MKRQPIKWEKIFANDISDKGLISKMHKKLIQVNTKQSKQASKQTIQLKVGKGL